MKLAKQAKELLDAANKVFHFRKDVISEDRLSELNQSVGQVKSLLKSEANEEELESSIRHLDKLLAKIGVKSTRRPFGVIMSKLL